MKILLVSLFLILTLNVQAQTILIKNAAKIHTVAAQGTLENADILIENGKIKAIGKNLSAERAEVIDAKGKVITPGLIDSYSRIGLTEIEAVSITVDFDEGTAPVVPQMRTYDAINPESRVIPVTRQAGITTVLSAPSEANLFNGQSCAIKLRGRTVEEMSVKATVFQHAGLGEAPKARWAAKNIIASRMGEIALMRTTLVQAQEYQRKTEKAEKVGEEKKPPEEKNFPPRDLKLESLVRVLKGEAPLAVAAYNRQDILAAISIADEFNLKLVILHGTDAYLVSDELKKRNIPVIIAPVRTPPDQIETADVKLETAALLVKAGITVAIGTAKAHNSRQLVDEVGYAMAYGLSFDEGLKCVTLTPATLFGIENRTGSLEVGKDADLAVWNGTPFEVMTKATLVMISGEIVYRLAF